VCSRGGKGGRTVSEVGFSRALEGETLSEAFGGIVVVWFGRFRFLK